jgi:hypothetical protein
MAVMVHSALKTPASIASSIAEETGSGIFMEASMATPVAREEKGVVGELENSRRTDTSAKDMPR